MGSSFSSGPFRNVKDYVNLDLVRVKSLMFRFQKTVDRNFEEYTFITKRQFQWTLKLTDRQTFRLWQRFDPDSFGRVPMIDVFGALGLASSENPGEKINFCFALIDLDKDEHVSRIDLTMLIRCCTRGFSKLKLIDYPSMKSINHLVAEAFETESITLNERGEISLSDLRAFIMAHDLSRTYLANLGTEIAIVDTGKLVIQRAEVSAKLAEQENRLRILMMQQDAEMEDEKRYHEERGGDASLVKLSEDALAEFNRQKNESADDNFEEAMVNAKKNRDNEAIDGVMTEAQRLRRLLRRKDTKNNAGAEDDKNSTLIDATVFVQGCKPSQGRGLGFDSSLEQSMGYKWELLEPQSSDKLVKLDLDVLEDLFEAGGITLTDAEAMLCLDKVQNNQLGRYKMKNILRWYRDYRTNPPNLYPSEWLSWSREVRGSITSLQNNIFDFARVMSKQYTINKELKRLVDMRPSSQQNDKNTEPTNSSANSFAVQAAAQAQNMFADIQGAARLAAWQRQAQLDNPSIISFAGTFGKQEEEEIDDDEDEEGDGDGDGDDMVARMRKARKKMEAELNKWHGHIIIDIISKSEISVEKLDLIDDQGRLTMPLEEIECSDVLEYFNKHPNKTNSHIDEDELGVACAWMIIDIAEGTTEDESKALLKSTLNFWNSIPHDFRDDLYQTVRGQVVLVPDAEIKADKDTTNPDNFDDTEENDDENEADEDDENEADEDANDENEVENENENEVEKSDDKPQKNPQKAILIALINHHDAFRKWEESLPPGLLLSRGLRQLNIKIDLRQSLDDLYEMSAPFEYYTDRLYGPQEDELGEEGMNPIRFAKLCRERVKAIADVIEGAETMNIEDIKMHLQMRGLDASGTLYDVKTRLQRALQRQSDILGFGELSNFGEEMCKRIFDVYDMDRDEALSMWELNNWLSDLGSETIVDQKDYAALLREMELATDENGFVTLHGMSNYYERYGRLVEDMKSTGIGALHEFLQGQYEITLDFESEALLTLLNMLESHSTAFTYLKTQIKNLASLKDFIVEGTYERLGDMPFLKKYSNIMDIIKTPGWLVRKMNYISETIADGDSGIIRSMKLNALDHFGTYGAFDSKLSQVFSSLGKYKKDRKDEKEAILDDNKDDDHAGGKKAGKSQLDELLDDVFPSILDSKNLENKIAAAMKLADSIRVKLGGDNLMTRMEKELAKENLRQSELDVENGIKQLDECVNLTTAHASAWYDCMRIYSSGIASFGVGSKEFFCRVYLKGFNFFKYLPRAAGEASLRRFRREDRVRRATERKKAAFAAMERERARRNMTDEEKARQKQLKQEKAQAKRDDEEKLLFNEGYIALVGAREERKGEATIRKMIDAWRRLAMMRDQRYPNTLKAALCCNNYAVVLKEFSHIEPSFISESVTWAIKGALIVNESLKQFNQSFDNETLKANEASEKALERKKVAGYVLIMQNMVTLLRDTTNVTALRKYIDVRMCIWRLFPKLTEKEKKLIGAERKVEGMITLPLGDVKANLEITQRDALEYLEEMRLQDLEAARLAGIKIKSKGSDDDGDDDGSSTSNSISGEKTKDSMDPEYLALLARRERAKKEKARKKARAKEKEMRTEAIKSRNKLYGLISSGEINHFFEERAENPALANEDLPWLRPDFKEDGNHLSQGQADSLISGVTEQVHDRQNPDPNSDYLPLQPFTYSTEPNVSMTVDDQSMSVISNVSDFGRGGDNNSIDQVSHLGSIAEYQEGFDDPDSQNGKDSNRHFNKKKTKGIFSWLFRGREQR